jgi:3-hydroxyacyl-CoA dehydrogenase
MGSGIAEAALQGGFQAIMMDNKQEFVKKGTHDRFSIK